MAWRPTQPAVVAGMHENEREIATRHGGELTVIIPAYDEADSIADTIRSLQQTRVPAEPPPQAPAKG